MSAFTLRSHTHRDAPHRSALVRLAAAAMTEWRSYAAARSLRMMDDRALHDIGVSRAEIGHAVRYGRD